MQTILGAGGIIGRELAKALPTYTNDIRLASRHPEKVNPTDEVLSADLTQPSEVLKAVANSEIAYLTVGLPYSTKTWQTNFPLIMQNVIDACKTYGTKLVFFDNIYMYDPDFLDGMTEETPFRPVSKKGVARAQIAQMVMDVMTNGEIEALIARSADFYGPNIHNVSILTEIVFSPLSQGKTATWLGSATKKHAFTYTPDAGKATALLGNTPTAYGQVWHLPTAPNPPTGDEWVKAIAKEFGVKPSYRTVSKSLMRFLGIFSSPMRETVEMIYQYERDYMFDSSKFETEFGITPTPYLDGIKQIVTQDYSS